MDGKLFSCQNVKVQQPVTCSGAEARIISEICFCSRNLIQFLKLNSLGKQDKLKSIQWPLWAPEVSQSPLKLTWKWPASRNRFGLRFHIVGNCTRVNFDVKWYETKILSCFFFFFWGIVFGELDLGPVNKECNRSHFKGNMVCCAVNCTERLLQPVLGRQSSLKQWSHPRLLTGRRCLKCNSKALTSCSSWVLQLSRLSEQSRTLQSWTHLATGWLRGPFVLITSPFLHEMRLSSFC